MTSRLFMRGFRDGIYIITIIEKFRHRKWTTCQRNSASQSGINRLSLFHDLPDLRHVPAANGITCYIRMQSGLA